MSQKIDCTAPSKDQFKVCIFIPENSPEGKPETSSFQHTAPLLANQGFDVEYFAINAQSVNFNHLLESLKQILPQAVLFHVSAEILSAAARLAQAVNNIFHNCPVLLYGDVLSDSPAIRMKTYPAFDVGIIGHNSEALIKLLHGLKNRNHELDVDFNTIPGLVYRAGENYALT